MTQTLFCMATDEEMIPSVGDSVLATDLIAKAVLETEEQILAQKDALEFRQANSDWLYRSCSKGHLTASALVVNRSCTEVLLINHRKLGLWLQPGGHADGDGNLAFVALKEVGEETGLTDLKVILPASDIDIHVIPENRGDPEHLHIDLRFVILADGDETLRPNHETRGAQWVNRSDPRLEDGNLIRPMLQALDIASSVTKLR